jgi:hypothetical protein
VKQRLIIGLNAAATKHYKRKTSLNKDARNYGIRKDNGLVSV